MVFSMFGRLLMPKISHLSKQYNKVAIHIQITNFLIASRDTAIIHDFGEYVLERDRVNKSVFISS